MNSNVPSIAHVAIPVRSIQETRDFYGKLLGCAEGRLTETMVDFNFFGLHLVAHLASERIRAEMSVQATRSELLSRHVGVIVNMDEWRRLARTLADHPVNFVMGPEILHQGTPLEEGLIFLLDPSGNAVEFKGFDDPARLSKALEGTKSRVTSVA